MDANRRKGLMVSSLIGTLGCIWAWLSQMYFVTSHSEILQIVSMVWVILHLPIHLILSIINPPRYLSEISFYVGVFLQWFLIGWLGFAIRQKLKRPNE